MNNIKYVTDEYGNRMFVQIPLEQWEAIKLELAFYDEVDETKEILSDSTLLRYIEMSRKQSQKKIGRPLSKVEV